MAAHNEGENAGKTKKVQHRKKKAPRNPANPIRRSRRGGLIGAANKTKKESGVT